jgi:serine/threonine protein kinase
MRLSPSDKLGPYEILGEIGAGGMGEVYRARDTRLDRIVALKILPPGVGDPDLTRRFEREARAVAVLNHPNICVVHDVGRDSGVSYFVMEYLEGETLAARLSRGALPIRQALQYAVAIADALDKAHRTGVVHRDVKPSNIVLTAGGPKLLDFGLAKLVPAVPGRGGVKP